MELRRDAPASGPLITGFSGRGFRVNDTVFPDGVLITPEDVMPWTHSDAQALSVEALGDVLTLMPRAEFLLLGTGVRLVHPPRAFVRALEAMGLGVEAMDSRAAARAWGVLRAEERWIVGALMAL